MGNLGYGEMLVIVVVGLILFGPDKIPEFARSLGKAVNSFKTGLREGLNEEIKPAAAISKPQEKPAHT